MRCGRRELVLPPTARNPGGFRADYGFVATIDKEIKQDLERDVSYGITDTWEEILETDGDYKDAGGRSQKAEAAYRGTEADKETLDSDGRPTKYYRKWQKKRRTTRLNPETTPAATAATTTTVTSAQLQAMINQDVTAALAARDANTNGVDSHNSGTGARRNERATHECTYPDFMKWQPLNFKGTERVVELNQRIEKIETVFRISNCSVENQIKFSTCTLLGNALTCPRTEIKKIEVKLWELKVKGTDVIGYNQHFQELALLCGRMFPEVSYKIEKYVGGLPDMIYGSLVASKPKIMQEATEMAIEVMDKRIRTFADHRTENKRKPNNS
ncbi:hypothetical protein Tco_0001292 [Tanacetum coccineum]